MDNLAKSYFALSGIGIVDAAYHAYTEISQNFNACTISSSVSCQSVFASGYVSIFGIPFYATGLLWFPLMLLLGLWLTDGRRGQMRGEVLVPALMVGNVFTIYLWYLELFRIGAICPVCVSLYIINYAMTAIALVIALR